MKDAGRSVMIRKFQGMLAERREPRQIYNYLMPLDMRRQLYKKWQDEDWEKLMLLCEVYEVPVDGHVYLNLCLALAQDFIPGFQEKQKTGPKQKWTPNHDSVLLVDMEKLIADRKCSARAPDRWPGSPAAAGPKKPSGRRRYCDGCRASHARR